MSREEQFKYIKSKQEEYKKLTQNEKFSYWREYNSIQTNEKHLFYKLLNNHLKLVETPAYSFGRPRKFLRDMIFCCVIKVYSDISSRKVISELHLTKEAGYIKEIPHFNTVINYFSYIQTREAIKSLLKKLGIKDFSKAHHSRFKSKNARLAEKLCLILCENILSEVHSILLNNSQNKFGGKYR